jgi:hypothetical protein
MTRIGADFFFCFAWGFLRNDKKTKKSVQIRPNPCHPRSNHITMDSFQKKKQPFSHFFCRMMELFKKRYSFAASKENITIESIKRPHYSEIQKTLLLSNRTDLALFYLV